MATIQYVDYIRLCDEHIYLASIIILKLMVPNDHGDAPEHLFVRQTSTAAQRPASMKCSVTYPSSLPPRRFT